MTRDKQDSQATRSSAQGAGTVWLVGAGPGDPELLTLKAARLLRQADVVLYDNLVHEDILCLCEHAHRVNVGKVPGGRRTPQARINELLAQYAGTHATIVRLKGGDPFVFGRGGEEAIYLRERGIDVHVVPGVSSCIAAPAAAGIPVTHRGISTHFTVVTGVGSRGSDTQLAAEWRRLADNGGTLVFLMGVGRLERIVANLITAGLSEETPAAIVASGTRPGQVVVEGTLADIAQKARVAAVSTPATIVVGDVVALRNEICREPTSQSEPEPATGAATLS